MFNWFFVVRLFFRTPNLATGICETPTGAARAEDLIRN